MLFMLQTVKQVEVFLKRYLPRVWILKDPHNSLDAVRCDALLETAETCSEKKKKKEKSVNSEAVDT